MALEAILSGLVEVKGAGAAASQIRGLGAEIQAAGAAGTRTAGQLGGVGKALSGVGRFASSTGSMLTRYVSAPLALIGGAAVGMAIKFDTSFARIQGLAGKLGMSMDKAKAKVLSLAGATGQDPQSLADALYFVASAGLKASSVFPVLEASAKGAEIGMGDVGQVAQTLTSLLNAYAGTGLTAGNAMNIMTSAVKDGKAEMSDFATGLGPVIAVAANAGVSFSELAAGIAQATNVGVPFDRAVTGMRFLISSLTNPTGKASSALKDFGIKASDLASEIKDRGLIPVLQDLYDKLNDGTAAGREAWAAITGGARGSIVAVDLVGSHVAATNKILRDTGSAAKESATNFKDAFGTIVKNDPNIQFQKTLATLKADLITLGNDILPVVSQALGYVDHLAKSFSHLTKDQQANVIKWGAILIAAGPVLRIFGGIVGLLVKMGGLFRGAAAGAEVLAGGGALGGIASVGVGAVTVLSEVALALGTINLVSPGAGAKLDQIAHSLLGIKKPGFWDEMVDFFTRPGNPRSPSEYTSTDLKAVNDKLGSIFHTYAKAGGAPIAGMSSNEWLQTEVQAFATLGAQVEHTFLAMSQFSRQQILTYGGSKTLATIFGQETGQVLQTKDGYAALYNVLAGGHKIQDGTVDRFAKEITQLHAYGGTLHGVRLKTIEAYAAAGNWAGVERELQKAVDGARKKIDGQTTASQAAINALHAMGAQSGSAAQRVRDLGTKAGLSKRDLDTLIGDVSTYTGHVKNIPKSALTKIDTPGFEAALAHLRAIEAAANAAAGTYGISFRISTTGAVPQYVTALGGVRHFASGAITAQTGLIARAPVRLVGEGTSPTFAGRGAEAIVPLDSRGIGILGKALTLALQPLLGKLGGGDGERPVVVVPVVFRDEFRREVQGALMKDIRFRSQL